MTYYFGGTQLLEDAIDVGIADERREWVPVDEEGPLGTRHTTDIRREAYQHVICSPPDATRAKERRSKDRRPRRGRARSAYQAKVSWPESE